IRRDVAKPKYYLTFLGEPASEQGSDVGLPAGEEIYLFLKEQLASRNCPACDDCSSATSWCFVVRQNEAKYCIDLSRPFMEAFDSKEWLIITEQLLTLKQRFFGATILLAERLSTTIADMLS